MNFKEMTNDELKEYIKAQTKIMHLSDKRQHALKIMSNSFYGCLGTQYFRHYNVHMAEGITLSGQVVVNRAYDVINGFINGVLKTDKDYTVAGDTDSGYIDMTDLVRTIIPSNVPLDKKLDTICKITDEVIFGKLEEDYEKLAEETNAFVNRINMERENIGQACFVAKKNYVMKVYDSEGTRYSTPKQKLTGLEAVKSSTPVFFREKLKIGYNFVFDKTEEDVHEFVAKVKEEYMNLPVEAIAGTTSVTELHKFIDGDGFISGTPGHVRGAILYNNKLAELKLSHYVPIRPGDKVKIVPLTKRNPFSSFGSNSFCYLDKFPHEILDERFIDRDGNFQKYFIDPYMRVLTVAGWNHEYVASLEDFFG